MEVQIPLIDGETVLDSEILIEANLRMKAIQRMIIGGIFIIIGIIVFALMNEIGEGAFYGGYRVIGIGIVIFVSGGLYLKDTSIYGIVITNFRLIEQFLYQNAPVKVIDHHYEFFESTEVPFSQKEAPKIGLILTTIGIITIIGAIIATVLEYPLLLDEFYFPYIIGGILVIGGLLWYFLGGGKATVIHFEITKTSRSKLDFYFPVGKFTEERIYDLINKIILASREFINKTAT